jgi:predicted metal-dependent hydrolase
MQFLPSYRHIVSKKLKHTYLTFDDKGDLVIKSPKVSQAYIEKLLIKKASWIKNSKEKIAKRKSTLLTFSEGDRLYYKGEAFPLLYKTHKAKRVKLTFEENVFTMYYGTYDEKLFQKHINSFYKKEAENNILPMVVKWSKIMGLKYSKVSFRKTKRQWGSCSSQNALSFNTMMLKLPQSVMEYVVIHELAHIKHKHHQKTFWSLVANYVPDYKEKIVTLKEYSTN